LWSTSPIVAQRCGRPGVGLQADEDGARLGVDLVPKAHVCVADVVSALPLEPAQVLVGPALLDAPRVVHGTKVPRGIHGDQAAEQTPFAAVGGPTQISGRRGLWRRALAHRHRRTKNRPTWVTAQQAIDAPRPPAAGHVDSMPPERGQVPCHTLLTCANRLP
jgi:hypothetical protein